MNKKIKFIVKAALIMSVLTSVCSVNSFGNITKAYASETASIYLKNLSLSKSDVDFDEDVFYYSVKVDKDADEIKITAKPKSENASVSVDGEFVNEDDNYRKVVSLEKGTNIVKVEVSNDEETKIYTLNILRGEEEKDDIYLNGLNLSNCNLNFSKDITNYNVKVKENVDKITIGAVPEDDSYEVKIDGGKANKDEGYKQTINLNKGKNTIVINVKDKKDKERTYILNITRENSLDNKTTQDDIYLNYIKVDKERINIQGDKSEYSLNLSENTSQVDITAEPDKVDYKVKINNKSAEEEDDYTGTVVLKRGRNPITIKVQDEVNKKQRIYTLNLNVGAVDNASDNSGIVKNNNQTTTRYNQWTLENNKWKYYDSTGNYLKSTWFFDKNNNKYYYLQADGTMATGWFSNNGQWYYLGTNGAMQSGWVRVSGEWYYLNSDGTMQKGWIKDSKGNYYYLQDNGAMAKNTKINGYKVGNNGAWIKY